MKKSQPNPNPAGKAGKPIIVPQMSLNDAVKRMLATPVPSKEAAKKKPAKRKK